MCCEGSQHIFSFNWLLEVFFCIYNYLISFVLEVQYVDIGRFIFDVSLNSCSLDKYK